MYSAAYAPTWAMSRHVDGNRLREANTPMSATRRLLSLTMIASLALAACSAAATPSPAPTVGPSTAAATKTTDGTLPKPEKTSIKIGTPIGEPSQFAVALADQLGIYKKYGLDVFLTKFNAGGDATQALLAGATDVCANCGSDYVLTSQLTDIPALATSVYKSRVFDGLFCQKDIKTAADLKGKQVAISTLGATAHASVLLALKGLKMAENDVTVVPVGNNSARVAAMKAGSVACAPVSMDQAKSMTDLGLNLLIDLSLDKTLNYPAIGIGVTKEFHDKYPNTTLVLTAALLEAQTILINDLKTTAAEWAKFAQIDVTAATTAVQAVQGQVNPTMQWTDDAFAFSQQIFAKISPSVMLADVTKAGDHTILQKLVDIGFNKKIGAPTS
jgi:NitT/TauT family transport system substrate-binding protein